MNDHGKHIKNVQIIFSFWVVVIPRRPHHQTTNPPPNHQSPRNHHHPHHPQTHPHQQSSCPPYQIYPKLLIVSNFNNKQKYFSKTNSLQFQIQATGLSLKSNQARCQIDCRARRDSSFEMLFSLRISWPRFLYELILVRSLSVSLNYMRSTCSRSGLKR